MAAFSVSAYSGVKRTCKPFNAVLGETYEFACPEKGFRFFSEKVPGRQSPFSYPCLPLNAFLIETTAALNHPTRQALQ
jgi:hypothetical protein